MKDLFAAALKANLISDAEKLINNFLSETDGVVYVINADGSTFTLEPGCTLLGAESYR